MIIIGISCFVVGFIIGRITKKGINSQMKANEDYFRAGGGSH